MPDTQNLARAKAFIARLPESDDITVMRVPITEFDREEIIKVLGLTRRQLEEERESHGASVEFLTGYDRVKG